jgi:hypothetical protein
MMKFRYVGHSTLSDAWDYWRNKVDAENGCSARVALCAHQTHTHAHAHAPADAVPSLYLVIREEYHLLRFSMFCARFLKNFNM